MSSEIIKVPDIGGSTDVEIIEIAVAVGDVIAAEDTMITRESDKASMDVPAPKGGKVVKVLVKEGDTVSEGDDILELEAEGGGDADQDEAPAEASSKAEDEPAEKAEQKPFTRSKRFGSLRAAYVGRTACVDHGARGRFPDLACDQRPASLVAEHRRDRTRR